MVCLYLKVFCTFSTRASSHARVQERIHEGALKELNISKLETEHQPSLTARIIGCCSVNRGPLRNKGCVKQILCSSLLKLWKEGGFPVWKKKKVILSKDCEVCQGHLDNQALQVQ